MKNLKKGDRFICNDKFIIEATEFYFRIYNADENKLIPAFKFIKAPPGRSEQIELVIYSPENLKQLGFKKIN